MPTIIIRHRHVASLTFLAVWSWLAGLELILVLRATQGHLLFTLDDPFIHLALAERLADGRGYGLNAGEAASPASSILYPFLLVPLRPLGQWGPWLLGFAAAAACGLLAGAILRRAGWAIDRAGIAAHAGLALVFILATNLLGLLCTGLEHGIHLALTLACVLGAQSFLAKGRPAGWWLAAAAFSPLIRYEGVSNLLAVALLLAWHRRFAVAALVLAAGCLGPVLFGVWLHSRGLPPLPASVLVKAAGSGYAAGHLAAWWDNRAAEYAALPLFCVCVALLAAAGLARRSCDTNRLHIAAFGLVIAGAQLCLGRFGGFSRYEIYAVAAGMLSAAAALAPSGRARRLGGALALAALLACFPYARRAFQLPQAASGIYRQQYQMHRFVNDYWRAAVAANDIGLVSYHNPNHVLDLWGLGSEAARRARFQGRGTEWMDRLARQSSTDLAMLYPDWFGPLPPQWRLVGLLRLRHGYLVNGGREVGFYATTAGAVPRIRAALEAFVPTLPANADFVPK